MKIVITGGTGFIGLRLARRILEIGHLHGPSGTLEPVDDLVLFDTVVPEERPSGLDARARLVRGEIADRDAVFKLFDRPDIGVFHLASVVSAGAEQDFDLALKVNLQGHIHVLDALRRVSSAGASPPRYVFSSSLAAYGGTAMPRHVTDATRETPQTTYGMTKAVGELLINDYSRKDFIDGRSGRLAAVIVRPGKPNKAASGFASGMIREPLNGIDFDLPIPLTSMMPVVGYRTVIECLIALYEVDGARLGDDRALNIPNVSVTMAEVIESLSRVAGTRKLGRINVVPDPFITAIVAGWPTHLEAARAGALGLPREPGIDAIIRAYIEDYVVS